MNLNRLFPRLSITAKLAIAFVGLALGPIVVVTWMGTVSTVQQMRERERELLEHDLETVGQRTALSLRDLAGQVGYVSRLGLADLILGEGLARASTTTSVTLESALGTYLSSELTTLFRAKVLDGTGTVVAHVQSEDGPALETESAQPFYLWLASELDAGQTQVVPVELRGAATGELIPAVAAVTPVRDEDGALRGAVVGEARASDLFDGIDDASPGAAGVTGVVDHEGRFLYHTTRKRDWATLLARRSEEGVRSELSDTAATAILSGRTGTIEAGDGMVATFRPLVVPDLSVSPFFLYRAIPQATLGAPVRRYILASTIVAGLVVLSVLGAAVVAARQFTRPLHRLSEAARQVRSGGTRRPLEIETNDEIQDLAEDFEIMAAEVERHRQSLEATVEERTRSLHRVEEELSRIVSMSADAIVGLDASGRVRHWNRGAEQLLGYTARETDGRDLDDLILPPGPRSEEETAYLRRTLDRSGAVIAYQTVRRTKSGERIPVGLTHTVLEDDAGEVLGHSVIIRDNRMNEQLQESMRRSERLAAVSVMAAGLAHELNNPLAILGNRIELMQRDIPRTGDYDRLRKDLGVLGQHVDRLGTITRDLLRFARDKSETGEPVEVNDVVTRVVRLMDRVLAAQGVTLESQLEAGVPRITANTNAVETALVNLILNAQQASPAGGTVTVGTRARPDHRQVEVEVSDSGPGVPTELRHRIFEPFFTTKAERGGTGLGLAVCRALMERQGGTIHLAGGNGRGAAFVLSFPVAAEEPLP